MRPEAASNSTMGTSGLRDLRSPIPYLFGGLALMFAVISVALLILACSYRKQHRSSGDDEEKPPPNNMVEDVDQVNSEPKIVVIMAGESNPTYLAKPVSSTTHTQQQPL